MSKKLKLPEEIVTDKGKKLKLEYSDDGKALYEVEKEPKKKVKRQIPDVVPDVDYAELEKLMSAAKTKIEAYTKALEHTEAQIVAEMALRDGAVEAFEAKKLIELRELKDPYNKKLDALRENRRVIKGFLEFADNAPTDAKLKKVAKPKVPKQAAKA